MAIENETLLGLIHFCNQKNPESPTYDTLEVKDVMGFLGPALRDSSWCELETNTADFAETEGSTDLEKASRILLAGSPLVLHEKGDEFNQWYLTMDAIDNAVMLAFGGYNELLTDITTYDFTHENTDTLLQLALFGNIVY